MIRKKTAMLTVFLFLGLWGFALPALAATSLTTKIEPNVISIGTFFNGIQVSVSGKISAENEVLILFKGYPKDLTLKKKGQVLGVLWMNLGELTFHQVPNLFLQSSSKGLDEFAHSHPEQWKAAGVGFEFFKRSLQISPPPEKKDEVVEEFIKLKKSQGLYAENPGTVHFEKIDENLKSFEATAWVPPKVAPGEYEVTVIEFHDGTVVAGTVDQLKVKEEGLPAMLSELAFQHGALYGILAVLIAIAAGLLMDFFFGQSQGAH